MSYCSGEEAFEISAGPDKKVLFFLGDFFEISMVTWVDEWDQDH